VKELPITKYHGCGNDFLMVHAADVAGRELEPLIVAACDRNTGIGADGFIVVVPEPLEMKFYNADGSVAPMCGNGIRCFAKFCLDEGLVDGDSFAVQTGAGEKTVTVVSRDPFLAQIGMGGPDYDPAAIHVDASQSTWGYELSALDRTVTLYSFFMSTVHTVWFVEDAMDDRLLPVAEDIHQNPIFGEKTNVNLVQVVNDHTIRMRTWERGVGPTLACGTGACASVLTAHKKGYCGPEVDVLLPKGQLHISIDPDEQVRMTGPACRILKGVYYDR
jgi:diaminopimelate epimerase